MTPAPALQRAVHEAADMLRAAGAEVVAWTPPSVPDAVRLYFGLLSADGGDGLRAALRGGAIDPGLRDLMRLAVLPGPLRRLARGALALAGQPTLAEFIGLLGRRDVAGYWRLVDEQLNYRQRFAEAMQHDGIDLVLSPPCALPAYRHGAARDVGLGGGYSLLWNLLGYPAGVAPVTRVRADEESARAVTRDVVSKAAVATERGSADLPVAVQIAARPWREHEALAAMRAIETAARQRADYPGPPPER
jgi:fatty acid amide hydrolase